MERLLKNIARNSYWVFYPAQKEKLESFLVEVWHELPRKVAFTYTLLAAGGILIFMGLNRSLRFPAQVSPHRQAHVLEKWLHHRSYFIRLFAYGIKSHASLAAHRSRI